MATRLHRSRQREVDWERYQDEVINLARKSPQGLLQLISRLCEAMVDERVYDRVREAMGPSPFWTHPNLGFSDVEAIVQSIKLAPERAVVFMVEAQKRRYELGDPIQSEVEYLDLLADVRDHGERRTNRTGTDTVALFGVDVEFDLRKGFPLMTTKKVHMKSIVHELLWMLSGSSRIDYLRENKVTIWDEWADAGYRPEMGYEDGDLGPVYGVQWRRWRAVDETRKLEFVKERDMDCVTWKYVDQVAQLVDKLRHQRDDRRMILSSWNVGEIHLMKLPPCHYAAQFHVDNDLGLHCLMSIRSWDLFLGGPFNIAQYALLTHMLAQVSGLTPRRLRISAGDAHVYVDHLPQVEEQLQREPRKPPRLVLDPAVKEIDDFRFGDVLVEDYDPHAAIKAEVAV